jgi:6-phosphogluconolactonase
MKICRCLAWIVLQSLLFAALAQAQKLYIGTYTNTDAHSRGIYSALFDPNTGALTGLTVAAETTNPSFLARHPSRQFLYAVNEVGDGSVSSFTIGERGLKLLGTSSTRGAAPCYLLVDRSGKWLLAANYSGGSVVVLPILSDGRAGDALVTRHTGSGPSPRQQGPHPHQIVEISGDRILVPDLGADRIVVYRLNKVDGALSLADPPEIRLPPGAGPRHLAPSAGGRALYVLSELASTVTVLGEGASSKSWNILQTVSLLSPDFQGRSTAAEIALHPNGRFLYASNRGADDIVAFSIDASTKRLTRVGAVPTGATPRFFMIHPTGKWLLAAGQTSGTVTVFAIDSRNGQLKAEPNPLSVPSPVFIGAFESRNN